MFHKTPVPINLSSQFSELQFPFSCSMHHDFMPISCSARIMISALFCANFIFSTHHNFTRFWELQFPFSCQALNHNFILAQTCPNSDVTKAMVNHRSYTKCHLQPYKRFLQMTCNCGTPLIHISHTQNIVDIFL